MNLDDLLTAWRVNNVINLEMLRLCTDDQLDLKPGKGKTIRSNYAHIISVRRMWAEVKLPKEAALVPKLDWKTATREEIVNGLALSFALMEDHFRKMAASTKPGTWSNLLFFAYCIAHEANHRAQIEIALRI